MDRHLKRLDTLQELELADGVEIRLRIAGPLLRGVALLIDIIVMWLLLILARQVRNMLMSVFGWSVGNGVESLLGFLIVWFYFSLQESGRRGATLGKRAMGLRVVQSSGTRIEQSQALVRGFIRFVDLLVPFAALVPFFNRKFQRLGDLVAGTVVVYSREMVEPVIPGPSPLTAVPVPVPLTREETVMLLKFRDRSGSWSEGRRMELVDHLKPLTGRQGVENVGTVLGMARWLDERK